MICPVCHTQIVDGATVCPACHADLAATRVIPKLTGSWCKSCGALVPTGAHACPKCGMEVSVSNTADARQILKSRELAGFEDSETTSVLPRIESAIPSEPTPVDEVAYARDGTPRTRVFLIAALASLIIVGGGILLITHPWDPDLNNTRATMPADTSQAGYPGEIERLSGQDSDVSTSAVSVLTADEQAYTDLESAYTQLGQLSKQADELEAKLDSDGTSGSDEARQAAYEQAQALSIDISNLASTIQGIETSSTDTYTADKQNLYTLASWLRNRIEAITASWKLSSESLDPTSDTSKILAPMQGNRTTDGSEAYVNLFSANYDSWRPHEL